MPITTLRSSSRLAILIALLSFLLVRCSGAPSSSGNTANTPIAFASATGTQLPPTAKTQQNSVDLFRATRTPSRAKTCSSNTQPTVTPAKSTPQPAVTFRPSANSPQIEPAAYRSDMGTPIPASAAAIDANTLTRLARVAQWGEGSLQRIVYSPDGRTLLAGSPFGIAAYDLENLGQPRRWLPFEYPVFFKTMQVSEDGTLIRLQWPEAYPKEGTQISVFNLADQKFEPVNQTTNWILSQNDMLGGYNELSIVSPDQTLRFESFVSYLEGDYNTEIFSGNIFDNLTGKPHAYLKDEQIYVEYDDFNEPEGCDLRSFSMCGNAYTPNIMASYRAAFSNNSRLLAILYRPPNLFDSQNFSLLRVYSTKDGSLVNTFGSFDQPVQDFAFQPGTDRLSVAFVSGSIQTWDPSLENLLHQAWSFSPPIRNFFFSTDGRYLLAKYADVVEVMRTSDGSVMGRYEASAVALSPRENLLALGSKTGEIQVEDLDQQKTVSRMTGHTAVIYALAFSPDGQTLTSSSEDCTVRSWDAHTGQFQHYFEKAEVDAIGEGWTTSRIFVYSMRYIPGSDQLVGFGSWGTAASWNTQSGVKDYAVVSQPLEYDNGMMTLNPHFPQSFWVVPEESRFYINEVAYDLQSGEAVGGYTPPANLPEGCGPEGPRSLDGTLRFTPGYGDLEGQICVLDGKDDRLLYRIPVFSGPSGGEPYLQQLFLSPDGTRLFVTSLDGPVFVYQIEQ